MRYRFYREHKYISYLLFELDQLIAKTDFLVAVQIERVKEKLNALASLLVDHAAYEEQSIHVLLKQKGSTVYKQIEADHNGHDKHLKELISQLDIIDTTLEKETKISLGYEFYLSYRYFVSDTLKHFYAEETIIMPELQRLYTDDELRKIEAKTYAQMTVEEISGMLTELFPHFNPDDREFFLSEIKRVEPEKFAKAHEFAKSLFSS